MTPRRDARILRFDRVERAAHWANALLFGVLLATGAILYIGQLSLLVGRRALIDEIHLYAGLALPVPLLVALAGSWGKGLRADLRRFNRWTADDGRWLRLSFKPRMERHARRNDLSIGKFNAGQKLNAAFTGGVIVVMLATGAVMHWYSAWPLSWRTGASFVHDWLALMVAVVVAGHICYALSDPVALRSMFTGTVPRRWATRHAPGWVAELEVSPAPGRTGSRPRGGADRSATPSG